MKQHNQVQFRPSFFILILCSLLLSGCFGIFMNGAQAVYNRYNLQNTLLDHQINADITQAIKSDAQFATSTINITCFHRKVLLTGETHLASLRHLAAKIAAQTHDVEHVYNFIEIRPVSETLEEIQDTWLTTKIKTKIIADAKMDPNNIKVVTENSTVYLMGILTKKQAKIAVDIARYMPDVKHVVKIFNYISYSKRA